MRIFDPNVEQFYFLYENIKYILEPSNHEIKKTNEKYIWNSGSEQETNISFLYFFSSAIGQQFLKRKIMNKYFSFYSVPGPAPSQEQQQLNQRRRHFLDEEVIRN